MLFSIITVTYNAESVLEPTLRSVTGQTFGDYEHIVMDGASTDSTVAMVQREPNERIRLTSEPDRGLYDAMNHALDTARGDYVIFMNAGDAFPSPYTLQHYADAIRANTVGTELPGIVYGQTRIIGPDRSPLGERHLIAPRELTLDSFKQGMVVCHQAMAVLRRMAGRYNWRQYRLSADYDWAIRCLQHSRRNVYLDEYVADYLRDGLSTAHRRRSLTERFRIMCHYYGTLPTLLRHIGFALRFLRTQSR